MGLFRRKVATGLLFALLAVGCLSPTLPLPPPAAPSVTSPDATGYVTLTAGAHGAQPDALVFCINSRTNHGDDTYAGNDGSYTMRVQANSQDHLLIGQLVNQQESDTVEVIVPP